MDDARQGRSTRVCSVLRHRAKARASYLCSLRKSLLQGRAPIAPVPAAAVASLVLRKRPRRGRAGCDRRGRASAQRSHTSHRSPSSLLSTRSRVLLRRCRFGRRGCAKHRHPRPQQQATVTLQAFRHDVLRRADERFIPAPPDERLTPARRGGVWCVARYGARQHEHEPPPPFGESPLHAENAA